MPELDCIDATCGLMNILWDKYKYRNCRLSVPTSGIYGPGVLTLPFPSEQDGKDIYSLNIGYPCDGLNKQVPIRIALVPVDENGDLCGMPFDFWHEENQSLTKEVLSSLLAKIDEFLAISQKKKQEHIKMLKQEEEEQKKKSDEINASSRARTDYFREPKPESWYPCTEERAFKNVRKQSQRERKKNNGTATK